MADSGPEQRRDALRAGVVWKALRDCLEEPGRQVLDLGGGTGGFAVRVAEEGHQVTVVDPSPDALAALDRRVAGSEQASDGGLADRVRGIQGDAADLLDVVAEGTMDVVLCHGVLEMVDDPAEALRAVAAVLRPGGRLSLLVAQRNAAVLSRALAGHLAEAQHVLDDPAGRWGAADPLRHRFTQAGIAGLLEDCGFAPRSVQGVRVLADLVPSAYVDTAPGAFDALVRLESALADHPELRAVATRLHVLARRR